MKSLAHQLFFISTACKSKDITELIKLPSWIRRRLVSPAPPYLQFSKNFKEKKRKNHQKPELWDLVVVATIHWAWNQEQHPSFLPSFLPSDSPFHKLLTLLMFPRDLRCSKLQKQQLKMLSRGLENHHHHIDYLLSLLLLILFPLHSYICNKKNLLCLDFCVRTYQMMICYKSP
jgi:hypothetical protein